MMYILFMAAQAFAAEGGHGAAHGHEVHVPWHTLFVQAFNLIFLLVVLGFLLRKTVAAHFSNRAAEYNSLVQRAEAARLEAEKAKKEVEQKLARLQSGAANTVQQAEAEAAQLKTRMMEEARQMTQKLEAEAKNAAHVELEKAKAELRRELLAKALESSKENLQKNLGSNEQKKLQNEFVEKIQVVSG